MIDSVFKVQSISTTNDLIESSSNNPLFRVDLDNPDMEIDAENEKLLVIPISKEIARDFSLIGYDTTVRHIEELLSQASKRRNVCLFGDNGIGKTAIIQGLVQRKNLSDLSMHMYKRTFYRLNTSKLLHNDDVAEINKQFEQILLEFGQYDVLVIENFYTLVGYLKNKGANVVLIGYLEALSRKKFQSIITCSSRERALLFTEIPEVHEFFAPESVSQPNDDELLNILRGVRKSYETRYGVIIPDDSLKMIRDLSQKYRTNLEEWAQPGRALIVLDRAIAQFSVRMNSKPSELSALENEANILTNEIDALSNSDGGENFSEIDHERRQELIKRLDEIQPELTKQRNQWNETVFPIKQKLKERAPFDSRLHDFTVERQQLVALRGNTSELVRRGIESSRVSADIEKLDKKIAIVESEILRINGDLAKINLSSSREHRVTADNIRETYSEITGISFKQLSQDGSERALKIEEALSSRVVGQNEAIHALAVAVRRDESGLSDNEGTPKGSFLFLGPPGTGKTLLAKVLAEFQTGSEKNLIRIDMSEFMEKHNVSRLIGAPPGYAGYEEGGVFTNAVKAKPKSVIVLDEIEKAHEDVFKILLQVLGDGRLTDGQGCTINFDETYIIMTSNIGTAYFLDENLTYDEASALALKEVNKFFAPDLRSRFDSIICFRCLDLPELEKVIKARLLVLNKNIAKRSLKLEISDDSITSFCKVYRDDRYGGRGLLKKLKEVLEGPLSAAVLAHDRQTAGTLSTVFNKISFEPLIFMPSATKIINATQ